MKIKKCKFCGKEFEYQLCTAKFCSGNCKEKYRVRNTNHNKKCEHCDKPFYGRKNQRFCSQACSLTHTSPNILKKLECVDCGVIFMFKGRTSKKRCDLCRKKHRSKQSIMYQAHKDPTKKVGVGSGGNQLGEDNHQWNPSAKYHGNTGYQGEYRVACYKHWDKECVLCNKVDGIIDVHHINGQRDDIRDWNLIPVCRKCHGSKLHNKKHISPLDYSKTFFKIAGDEVKKKVAEIKSRN